ncbi:amino acid ABC transporter ATP-binding/permease protein [Sphingopyxis sp.]|jgi:ATP-binding cassette subfamily C protein CydC|uniref:amino acid ABC transporter ATP-binding/permease protein n=1 Tax=Sphingopyxis sp. TaxID=1908224 RepID=UPI0040363F3B
MIEDMIRTARARQRRAVASGMIAAAVAALSAIGLLAVSGWFLTGAALAGLGGVAAVQAFNYLIPSAAIRGLAILRTLSRYGERLFSHRAMLFALADVRTRLFARLVAAPPAAALRFNRGEVAARLGSDVEALEEALLRTTLAPSGIATLIGALALAAFAGIIAVLALCAAAATSLLLARWIGARWLAPALDAERDATGQLIRQYVDLATGGDDILVYALDDDVRAALGDAQDGLHQARVAMVRADAALGTGHWLATGMVVAAIVLFSAAPAPLVALSSLAAAASMEIVGALVRLDLQRWKSRGARERLDVMFPVPSAPVPPPPVDLSAAIVIDRHRIARGDRFAVTGASGSGKTRLIETLAGLRNDAPQSIEIARVPVADLPLSDRRSLFALAAQDASMIAGTVADNLALARPGITRAAMAEALFSAGLDDVVATLPGGLDCWLGDDGARLSGGQRRRLSLARALLADRPFLLLDEPSEGLDLDTEGLLVARLRGWLDATGTGLIIVSHRLAMLELADRRMALQSD